MPNDIKQAARMLRAAQSAVNRIRACTRDQIERDEGCYTALIAQIVTIESAARGVSIRMWAEHPEIDWQTMAGLTQRFLTRHIYDARGDQKALPDYDQLWEVLNRDLPALIDALRQLIDRSLKDN